MDWQGLNDIASREVFQSYRRERIQGHALVSICITTAFAIVALPPAPFAQTYLPSVSGRSLCSKRVSHGFVWRVRLHLHHIIAGPSTTGTGPRRYGPERASVRSVQRSYARLADRLYLTNSPPLRHDICRDRAFGQARNDVD
jgi:hypothetical protein